jgi:hypothetical protein
MHHVIFAARALGEDFRPAMFRGSKASRRRWISIQRRMM